MSFRGVQFQRCASFLRRRNAQSAAVLLVALTAFVLAGRAQAALLVYEGFTGYTSGSNLIGHTVSADTIGLDTSAQWSTTQLGDLTVQASGLALGSLIGSPVRKSSKP